MENSGYQYKNHKITLCGTVAGGWGGIIFYIDTTLVTLPNWSALDTYLIYLDAENNRVLDAMKIKQKEPQGQCDGDECVSKDAQEIIKSSSPDQDYEITDYIMKDKCPLKEHTYSAETFLCLGCGIKDEAQN